MAAKDPILVAVRPNGQEDAPPSSGYRCRYRARRHVGAGHGRRQHNIVCGVGQRRYVNDFIDKGRVKKVYMQADAPFRMVPEDLSKWYVRNARATWFSTFSMFARGARTFGSPRLERFNGAPAMISRSRSRPRRVTNSGEAIAAMEKLAAQLPPGLESRTGLSYEERLSGAQAPLLTGCRSSSCSCVLQRCMRAGRFHSRCC